MSGNRRITVAAAAAAVLTVALLLVGCGDILDDTPDNPVEHLIEVERSNMEEASQRWENIIPDEWKELNEKMQESSFISSVNVSGDLDMGDDMPAMEQQLISGMLEESSINFTTKSDHQENKEFNEISGEIIGVDLPTIELLLCDDFMGLKSEQFYEQYLYFPVDEYGEFMREIDPNYVGPDEMMTENPFEDLISEEKAEEITERLMEHLYGNIEEEYLEVSEVDYDSPEGEVEVLQFKVDLTSEEAEGILEGFLKDLEEDEELLETFTEVMIDMAVDMASMFEATPEVPDAEDKEEMIEDIKEGLQEGREAVEFPEGFEMRVLVDDDDRIVERELDFTLGAADTGEEFRVVLNSNSWKYGEEEEEVSGELEVGPTGETIVVGYQWDISPEEEGTRENFHFSLGEPGADFFIFDGDKVNYTDSDTEKEHHDLTFDIEIPEEPQAPAISGSLKSEIDQDLDEGYHESKNVFSLDTEIPGPMGVADQFAIAFIFDVDVEFVDEVDLPDLEEKDAVNVMELDEEGWEEIINEIEKNAREFVDEFSQEFLGEGMMPPEMEGEPGMEEEMPLPEPEPDSELPDIEDDDLDLEEFEDMEEFENMGEL